MTHTQVDTILEILGINHLYRCNKPLIWSQDTSYKKESCSLHDCAKPYDAEVDYSEYFVNTKEDGPYASLLTDETFKKAFSPDSAKGKLNLLNLLNDMLEGQIPHRILDVYSQQPEINESGSKESRTSIFDLLCQDEVGDYIEIEVQIRKNPNFMKRLAFYSSQLIVKQGIPGRKWDYDVKPTYVIAVTRHKVFDNDCIIHRAGILDYATSKQLIDSVNFTVVELPKVKRIIRENDSEAVKWMYAFRYLNRLRSLPPALNREKFEGLLDVARLARFNKEELERYRNNMKMEWDDYAEEVAFIEDHPDFVKSIEDKAVNARDNEIVRMINDGMSLEKIKAYLEESKL